MVEIVEDLVVSLLGADEKPVPTIWHLQKEFFILTKANPKAQDLFRFAKHYEGPYSQILQDSVRDPVCYDNAIATKPSGEIYLTSQGKETLKVIQKKYAQEKTFNKIVHSLKLIRHIYEKLTRDELLFLIYVTYPEYVEFSTASDKLVKDCVKRKQLSNGLLNKGLITKERYEELITCQIE
jgi:hypothetical protein